MRYFTYLLSVVFATYMLKPDKVYDFKDVLDSCEDENMTKFAKKKLLNIN